MLPRVNPRLTGCTRRIWNRGKEDESHHREFKVRKKVMAGGGLWKPGGQIRVNGWRGYSLVLTLKSVTYKGHEFLLAELDILKVGNTQRAWVGDAPREDGRVTGCT